MDSDMGSVADQFLIKKSRLAESILRVRKDSLGGNIAVSSWKDL